MLGDDGLGGQTSASVALGDTGMTRQSLAAQQFGAKKTMTDVWLMAKTLNARSIGEENTDVMEHSGFLEETQIKTKLGMTTGYVKREISNATAVGQEYVTQRFVVGVVLIDNSQPA